MHKLFALIFAGGLAMSVGNAAGTTEETPAEDESVRCISMSQVVRTDVLDKQHLLFELIGGKYYVNNLPHACPGLNSRDPIMYELSQSQLCRLDRISTLQRIGAGFMPGVRCGLGSFEPIEAGKAELLRAEMKRH